MGFATGEAFRSAVPAVALAVERASADYRAVHASTARYQFAWNALAAKAQEKRQGSLMEAVKAAQLPVLIAGLDEEHRARVYSSGGAGALGFLSVHGGPVEMSDLQVRTAVRSRLR